MPDEIIQKHKAEEETIGGAEPCSDCVGGRGGIRAVDSTDEPDVEEGSIYCRSPSRYSLPGQQTCRVVECYDPQNRKSPVQEDDASFRVREERNRPVEEPPGDGSLFC